MVQLNNVTLSSAPQGNPYQYNSLPPTFGVVSEGGLLADSSTGGNPSSNVTFYYYPSSYSLVNQNFYGTTPNTTSTEDYVGFVQIYPNSASGTTVYQPEFIPIEEVNGSGTPVSPDGMTLTTSEPKISTATLAESDSFYEAQRGDTITAYVTRNSNLPAATVQYSLIPDSAQAGTDYDAGSTAPGTAGTVSFAANQTQATFTVTINSNPGDSGDKDFTIELLNPQETNPNDGYVASLTGGPANVLIKDNSPGQATTAGNVSTPNSSTNENANVGSSKGTIPAAAGKIEIAAPGNLASGSSAPDYALLEFNDGNDASDSLTTQGDTGNASRIRAAPAPSRRSTILNWKPLITQPITMPAACSMSTF